MTGQAGVLLVEADGPVRIVTLNRPDQLNAFSDELHVEFARLWPKLEDDPTARAVVLTGAGRAFCAGGSTEEFELHQTDQQARRKVMRSAKRVNAYGVPPPTAPPGVPLPAAAGRW